MAFTLLVLTGSYLQEDGVTPATGRVAFTLSAAMQDTVGHKIVEPRQIVAVLDGAGHFSVTLPANDDASTSPTGVTYTVVEQIDGSSPRTYAVSLPSAAPGGTVDLSTLAPALNPSAAFGYLLASVAGATYTTFVNHGATAGTARPPAAVVVLWEGSVAPSNATTGDLWYDTANLLHKRYNGAGWDVAGSATYRPNTYPSDVASRTGSYDAPRCAYNVRATSLLGLRAALGKAVAGTGYANVLCLGDSTTEGYGAGSDPSLTSYPAFLAAALRGIGVPDGGTGWVFPNQQNSPTNVDSRWTSSGFTNPGAPFSWLQSTVLGSTATFTSDAAGTILDFAYFDNGAAFTYSVDGAAPVTVTPTATNAVKTVSVTGLSNTTHSVLLTTTTNNMTYCAVAARVRQASGLLVNNAGIGGTTAANWMPSGTFYYPNPLTITGLTTGLQTYDATIISLGLNDWGATLAANTFQSNLQSVAQNVQGNVLLVIPPTPNGANALWTSYRQGYYNLADSLNLPLLDLGDLLGTYATANTNGLRFDSLHLSAPGYAAVAQALASVLVGPLGSAGDRKWSIATLQNVWTNYGSPFAGASYRKDANGYVHLRGVIKGGTTTSGTTLFALPAGYRPAANCVFINANSGAAGVMYLGTAGALTIQVGSGTYLSLDGISFLAEN